MCMTNHLEWAHSPACGCRNKTPSLWCLLKKGQGGWVNEKIKGKKSAREKERESCSCVSCTFQLSTRYAKSFSHQRDTSLLRLYLHLSLLVISVSSMFKMKTTKKYSKRLAHQNNPHAEIIETNGRKTSNQTDPHKIFKILNVLKCTRFQVWQVSSI